MSKDGHVTDASPPVNDSQTTGQQLPRWPVVNALPANEAIGPEWIALTELRWLGHEAAAPFQLHFELLNGGSQPLLRSYIELSGVEAWPEVMTKLRELITVSLPGEEHNLRSVVLARTVLPLTIDGYRIRMRRQLKKKSRRAAAAELHKNPRTLALWERNQVAPTEENLLHLLQLGYYCMRTYDENSRR